MHGLRRRYGKLGFLALMQASDRSFVRGLTAAPTKHWPHVGKSQASLEQYRGKNSKASENRIVVSVCPIWELPTPQTDVLSGPRDSPLSVATEIRLIKKAPRKKEGFPGGADGTESTCSVGDLSSILGLGRFPKGGLGNPLQYSYLENSHGQRSLLGCSPRSRKELDTTE